jgi:Integrase
MPCRTISEAPESRKPAAWFCSNDVGVRPRQADQGDRIALQSSWCKGGRAREVPLTHPRQRALLDELRKLCGDGSLIPDGQTYIAFRKEVEHATWSAGIRNMHGHRHWYAQWRYQILTGLPCPAAGGATYERLSRGQRGADYRARHADQRGARPRPPGGDEYLPGRPVRGQGGCAMKDQGVKLLPLLQQESRAVIEKRASVELNPGVLRVSILNAAREGQKALRVRLPNTLDVRGTETAAEL